MPDETRPTDDIPAPPWQPCDRRCPQCGKAVFYRTVEDSAGHEDERYWCPPCGKSWWVDGPDA